MRVLMISLDRRLLQPSDVVARHQKYADLAGALDKIVFSKEKTWREGSKNLRVFGTGSTKLFHFRRAFELASNLFSQNKYDLIIAQDFAAPVGQRLKRKFNIPFLVSFHSIFFERKWLGGSPLKWYMLYRIKKAASSADAFRVVNAKIQNKLRAWGFEKSILVEPTPIDIKHFFVEKKMSNPVPVILFVGRLTAEKNTQMLIEAFKELTTPAILKIVGAGVLEQKLKSLAGSSRHIHFLGPKSHEELPGIYRAADIFVLPSNTESFGWVLLEAAASRCAIIATKTPGASAIIKNGETGILIDIGNKRDLKISLVNLIKNPDLRESFGQKAQEAARPHDSQIAAARIVNFWKEVSKTT